jgi:GNAT superfamily N-acetyltransferase
MRIVELSDLPDPLGPQLAALNWLDGDPPQDLRFLRRLRRVGYPVSDYQALLAVEDAQILGKVETIVLPYVAPTGSEVAAGISGVVTRPDALRRGIARALLEEAHTRERTAGRHWAFLWTHRSWAAHHLYEELGYRDVYSPPAALRTIPRTPAPSLPAGYRWESIRSSDHENLERLLRDASRGRLGFIPRYAGSFRVGFQFGWRRPSEFRVLSEGSKPVGYAHTPTGRYGRAAYEVVVTDPRHAPAMLDALEYEAAGGWLTLARTTFITDHDELLRKRGYAVYRQSHPTLMAKPLKAGFRLPRAADPATVFRTTRFSFHGGDVF